MSSQIGFSLSHVGTAPAPLSYIQEVAFGTMPASPTLTAVKVIDQFTPRIDNMEMDVRSIGSHYLYGMQSGGHTYGLGLTLHPFDLPFLKIGTNGPNYTTPAGTVTASYAMAFKYYQSTGTLGYNLYNIQLLGGRPNTTSISISSQGLVEATQDWVFRDITKPTAGDISGSTWPAFPTTAVLSNIDAGSKPLTINGTAYAIGDFKIDWNNNLIQKKYIGSDLLDQSVLGAVDISGSFVTPAGQDTLLETAIHDFPQSGVTGKLTVKTGVMIINMTNMKLLTDAPTGLSAGPTDAYEHAYTFKCSTATLDTT